MDSEIGIIGGSGLYDMAGLTDRQEVTLDTPFGPPSGPYVTATLRGRRVAFLARHGAGHRILPGELNFRANIFGFKLLGVERILSASAVGSLREDFKPLDIVVPDQFFDRTRGPRQHVLRRRHRGARRVRAPGVRRTGGAGRGVGPGRRRHASTRRGPTCAWRGRVLDARRVEGLPVVGIRRHRHDEPAGGQARARGGDLLHDHRAGHRLRLLAPRARLGDRRDDHRQPGRRTRRPRRQIIAEAVGRMPATRGCACGRALAHAIITRPEHVPAAAKRALAPIIGKYLPTS